MAGLPKITADSLKASAEIAATRGETACDFMSEWLDKIAVEQGQTALATFIVEMCDGFFEDAGTKVKAVVLLGVILNAVNACIEAKELEELFAETT